MTRLPTTTTNDRVLRRSLAFSAGLHFLGLLFLFFGLPSLIKPLPTQYVPIPLEIVDIADMTNTRLKDQPEEPPKPPAPPPKPEQKAAAQPQPQPPQPQPTPRPQEMKSEQIEALMPKPAEKPKPPEAAKPKQDMLASVLKNVEKMKPAEMVKNPDKIKNQDQTTPQVKSAAPSLSDRLTVSEEDALRRQIEQCWNPPIGARNAQDLVVQITINVNPDRTVQSAEIVDKSRATGDPYFRAAGEAAIRALYNPRCSPLELPEGKYEQWKKIDFNFDPRDML